ncbi:MAG: inhibitor of cysteine peptidase [Rhodothermales bacterium]|jgi:inhibitor of cysteine peptidase
MRAFSVALILVVFAGCTTVRRDAPEPENQFGQRDEVSEDGRVTTVIGPADGTQVYRYRDAMVQEVFVRTAPPADQPVAVEVLVKGAFPDSCTELHEATQERSANQISVKLTTRRPQGALCAAVIRPFRFYLELEGSYDEGHYTLNLNGGAHPFQIRAPEAKGS